MLNLYKFTAYSYQLYVCNIIFPKISINIIYLCYFLLFAKSNFFNSIKCNLVVLKNVIL